MEHISHVGHIIRVEILNACNGGKAAHTTEPVIATGGAGIGKGWVEHHTRHRRNVTMPFRAVGFRIHIKHCPWAATKLLVVVERQGLAVRGEYGVRFRLGILEVTALPCVETAVLGYSRKGGAVRVDERAGCVLRAHTLESVFIEIVCRGRDYQSFQRRAIKKHTLTVDTWREGEFAQVEFGEACAIIEHDIESITNTLIGDIAGIETSQVYIFEVLARTEHPSHVSHFRCVKMAHINALQGASIKHLRHVGHLRGVEILQPCDADEIGKITEPGTATCGAGIGEGWVEHYMRHGKAIINPFWFVVS